ncbi:MAG: ATP-binding cassette domain-containing protein [Gemmatimonadaceae bacterium]|nr:ATP-binding cassette domain-containing protein [Gemmatimonadaceae bacterium]
MIELRDVTVRQGAFALDGATLAVGRGQYGVVLGAAGAGKTTLLEAVAGLRPLVRGTVLLDGDDVTALPPERRHVGMVYQRSLLFPHLDVRRNVAYGARGRSIDEAVERTGIAALLGRDVRTLSGGESQLVALARALASGPRVLLLDEPFAALDPPRRAAMRRTMRAWQRERGLTVLHVTHDVNEAALLADTLAVLDAGHVLQHGPATEVFSRPRSGRVAELVGAENVLAGIASTESDGMIVLRAGPLTIHATGERMEGPAHAVIGADEIVLSRSAPASSARNSFPARVIALGASGSLVRVELDVDGTPLVAAVTRGAVRELALAAGAAIHVSFKATAVRIC